MGSGSSAGGWHILRAHNFIRWMNEWICHALRLGIIYPSAWTAVTESAPWSNPTPHWPYALGFKHPVLICLSFLTMKWDVKSEDSHKNQMPPLFPLWNKPQSSTTGHSPWWHRDRKALPTAVSGSKPRAGHLHRWDGWPCEPHTAHPEEGGTATASGQATAGQTLHRADSKRTENQEHWPWSPAKPQLGASVSLLCWFSCLIFHLSLCVLLIYPVHSPWCFPIILFRRAAPNVLTRDPRWPWLDKVVRASLRLQPPANAVGSKCGTEDTQDSHVCAPWVFPSVLKAGLTVTEPQLCHSPSCVNVDHVTSPIQFPHLKNRDSNTYITEFKN